MKPRVPGRDRAGWQAIRPGTGSLIFQLFIASLRCLKAALRPGIFLLLGVFPGLRAADGAAPVAVDHDYVRAIAEKTAAAPYQPRPGNLPPFLRELSYDDYQRIRFLPQNALWRTDHRPFVAEFFHPGSLFSAPVTINEFTASQVRRIPFARASFDYADLRLPAPLPDSLEYAGFRLLYPLNQPGRWDEIVSFLGASYFRALGKGNRYGISARGLAIDSGGPGPEEFPGFVEFWLGQPEPGAKSLVFHALLDGPSLTGAYTFVITPGEDTVVEVKATLFFRSRAANVGLAPLTSMFWFGENSASRFGDFRSEVHDSDGLLVAPDAGTRLWRPLANGREMHTTDFAADALAGYGLLQRDRDYRSYADAEARYETRPSVWIEPVGPWPAGRVRLVELPTGNENTDNIVASWSLLTPPGPGTSLEFSYRMHWTGIPVTGGPAGRVTATRETVQVERPGRSRFIIDFDSPGLQSLPAGAGVTAEIIVPPGVKIIDERAYRNEADGSWRLAMLLEAPPSSTAVELRARLLVEGKPLTETWVGVWEP
jgi:glucans biosynthesis protein